MPVSSLYYTEHSPLCQKMTSGLNTKKKKTTWVSRSTETVCTFASNSCCSRPFSWASWFPRSAWRSTSLVASLSLFSKPSLSRLRSSASFSPRTYFITMVSFSWRASSHFLFACDCCSHHRKWFTSYSQPFSHQHALQLALRLKRVKRTKSP